MRKVETVEEFLKRGGKVKVGQTPKYESNGNSRYKMSDLGDKKPERLPGYFSAALKRRKGSR